MISPESKFLCALFETFNSSQIKYAVMRNYENLPESIGDSDLDLLISKKYEKESRKCLYDTIVKLGATVLGSTETVDFFKVCILGIDRESGTWWGLCIDLNFGLCVNGIRFLKEDPDLWSHSHRGVSVLPKELSSFLGFAKELFNNYAFSKKYAVDLPSKNSLEWIQIKKRLNLFNLDKSPVDFEKLLYENLDSCFFKKISKKIKIKFICDSFFNNPYEVFKRLSIFEISKIRRYFSPSGFVVAILGIDGVGKTSAIQSITPAIRKATHNAVSVYHLRPRLLPPLSYFKGVSNISGKPTVDPHGARPSGMAGSLFRLIYLSVDYVLGYWFKVRIKLAKQPGVVFFDRYVYDMFLDPLRFRISLPIWLIKLFANLVPKPDLILCLYAEPEIVYSRKQELPLEEVRRQVSELKDFAIKTKGAISISTDKDPELVRHEILNYLFEFLKKHEKSVIKK